MNITLSIHTDFTPEIVNQFIKDASIEKLEQVMYTFKNDKVIVNKIKELLALIKSYS